MRAFENIHVFLPIDNRVEGDGAQHAHTTESNRGVRRRHSVTAISLTWRMKQNGAFLIDGTNGPKDLGPGIHWVPAKYERAIARHLQTIRGKETGRIIERLIATATKRVTIVPEPTCKKMKSQTVGKPDGKSNVTIYFTPGYYVPNSIGFTYRLHGAVGLQADEALLHEVFHAMRMLTGNEFEEFGDELPPPQDEILLHPVSGGFRHNAQRILFYKNREEFNAVTIANIYISEKNNTRQLFGRAGENYDLRRDHNTENPHVPLATPHLFHNEPMVEQLIQQLVRSQRSFCEEIALVPATFNPIRDHLIRAGSQRTAFLFLRKFKPNHRNYEFYRLTTMSLQAQLGRDRFNAIYDNL